MGGSRAPRGCPGSRMQRRGLPRTPPSCASAPDGPDSRNGGPAPRARTLPGRRDASMKISPDSDIDNVRRLNPSALAVDQAPPPVDRALLARIVSQPRDEVLPNTPGTEHHR